MTTLPEFVLLAPYLFLRPEILENIELTLETGSIGTDSRFYSTTIVLDVFF